LEQAWRKLSAILWHDSVIFGKNFSDGRILSTILLESHSKSSHLGRRNVDRELYFTKAYILVVAEYTNGTIGETNFFVLDHNTSGRCILCVSCVR
jgi:hypothetical protein